MPQQLVSELRTLNLPALSPPWVAAVAMLALTLFVPGVLNDGDSFWHLAAGDPFSFSFAGAPWGAQEWLSEVLMAESLRVGGWSGVVVLAALAAALAAFQLARHLERWLPPGPSLLLLLLAGSCMAPSLLARPHILALPALEAWVGGLFIARSVGQAPAWRLLPVMCLWANLHGGFILGLLLVPPLALEAALTEPAAWRAVLARWGGFLLAATASATLTPNGWAGLLFPFQLMGMAELTTIAEWRPPDFSVLQPLELVLVAGLYVALTRGARLPPVRLLILLGLLHMSLHHTRHQLLVGVILPLLVAGPLGAALPPKRSGWDARRWHTGGLTTIAGLAALRLLLPVAPRDGPSAPITALAQVPPALAAQPVFNEYRFGGYLIFAHIPPFIDGRTDMYGDSFLRRYWAVTLPERVALEATFRDYGIRWTILAPDNPAVGLLDALPHWCRLYADDVAVVHTAGC